MSDIDRNYWTTIIVGGLIVLALLVRAKRWDKIKKISAVVGQFLRTVNIIKSMQFVPEAILTIDYAGKIIYTNNRVEKSFGWSEDEMKGEGLDMIIPKKYSHQFENFKNLHSGETDDQHLEIEAQRKSKELFPVEITIGKWHDDDDKRSVFYTIIIRDISHRKANEATSRRLRAELDSINALCNCGESLLKSGSWKWDMIEDKVIYSEGFRQLFGLRTGEQVTAADLMRLVHYEDRAQVNSAMLQASESKKGYEVEYRVHQPNGTMDLIRCVASPEASPNGKIIYLNGAVILIKKNVA